MSLLSKTSLKDNQVYQEEKIGARTRASYLVLLLLLLLLQVAGSFLVLFSSSISGVFNLKFHQLVGGGEGRMILGLIEVAAVLPAAAAAAATDVADEAVDTFFVMVAC